VKEKKTGPRGGRTGSEGLIADLERQREGRQETSMRSSLICYFARYAKDQRTHALKGK